MALEFNFPRTVISTSSDPTNTDDLTQGYSEGVRWLNKSTGTIFVCTSNTLNNAVWITQGKVAADGSIIKVNEQLKLDGDVRDPGASYIYGTDLDGDKGWISVAELVGNQIDNLLASINMYRFLLNSSPFERCYYNAFGTDESDTNTIWLSGGTYVLPTYTPGTYSYTVQKDSVIQTDNLITQVGGYARHFSVYVETDVNFTLEYTIGGANWIEISKDAIIDIGSFVSELKIRITFKSAGELRSFGVLYQGERGILYEFIEASNKTRYFETRYPSLAGDSVSSTFWIPNGEDYISTEYVDRYESIFKNGILFTNRYDYVETVDSTVYTLTESITAGQNDFIKIEKLIDENDSHLYYVEHSNELGGGSEYLFNNNLLTFTAGNNELFVYLNGVYQYPSSYSESANKITFREDTNSGDIIIIRKYIQGGNNCQATIFELEASDGQQVITLPYSYTSATSGTSGIYGYLQIYKNGLRMERGYNYDYRYMSSSDGTLSATYPLSAGDKIAAVLINYQ